MNALIFVVVLLLAVGYVVMVFECANLLERRFNLGAFELFIITILLAQFPLAVVAVYLLFSGEEKANTAKKSDP